MVLKEDRGGKPTLAAKSRREDGAPDSLTTCDLPDDTLVDRSGRERPAFRTPGGKATLPELIKFLNDRSGYIRALEDEGYAGELSRGLRT